MGQLFGEPIDAASGVFLITATDFMLMDIWDGQSSEKVQLYQHTDRRPGAGVEIHLPKVASTRMGMGTTLHCATAIDIRSRRKTGIFGRIKEEGIERNNETNV